MNELLTRSLEARERVNKLGLWFGNSLNIKEYPSGTATVSVLRNHIRMLGRNGFHPDLIVVDYGDLVRPGVRRKEKREELSDIFTELRGLGGEFNAGLCTGTQTNRGSYQKDVITMEDVSEDLGKMQIADLVIGLCQTNEEYANGTMRLFVAKNRDEKRAQEIKIFQDLSRGLFYQKMIQHGSIV